MKAVTLITLTENQIRLLLDLLYDHRQDGSYWGSRKQHYRLIEDTIQSLDPDGEYVR